MGVWARAGHDARACLPGARLFAGDGEAAGRAGDGAHRTGARAQRSITAKSASERNKHVATCGNPVPYPPRQNPDLLCPFALHWYGVTACLAAWDDLNNP
uniref:Uncharacterized protein n=1 Tax=Oryza sativa subsp. japonica TaxID=39947 RepID=Q652A0_ORYSJ|nr:hypothetical protein [Oryza sativa Japonica Group]